MGEIGSALERKSSGPAALIDRYKGALSEVMPLHVRPQTWFSAAQTALRTDAKLRDVAARNPDSLMNALAEAAMLGHQPGSDHYYLVPFGAEVQGIEGYKGLIHRMYRSGQIKTVHAHVVYELDEYSYKPGPQSYPDHTPFEGDDPGEMVRVYAYAEMISGGISQVAVLRKSDVERRRAESKGWDKPSSPWQKWPKQMWLKSAVRELVAWVPLSNEWRDAVPGSAPGRETVMVQTLDGSAAARSDAVVDAEVVD